MFKWIQDMNYLRSRAESANWLAGKLSEDVARLTDELSEQKKLNSVIRDELQRSLQIADRQREAFAQMYELTDKAYFKMVDAKEIFDGQA